MYEDKLEEIRSLKSKATGLRNRKKYDKAILMLDKAIKDIEALQKMKDEKDVRTELADTYGMKGGIYRRMDNLSKALEMYEDGKVIEDKDKVSSYNLSNVISLNIELSNKSPLDTEMIKDLKDVVERLESETKGSRKDEWWAWSDLAQFYLLLNQPDNARKCYKDALEKSGPSREEIQRHLLVLDALREKIVKVAPEISSQIEEITQWIK